MTAGRPRTADPKVLYGLASHLYWELKTVNEPKHKTVGEGLSRYRVDRKERARLLWQARKDAKLTPEELAELERGVDERIQKGFLPESERETCIRELTKDAEFERRFGGVNGARRESQKLIPIPGNSEIIDSLLNSITRGQVREICAEGFGTGKAGDSHEPTWQVSTGSLLPRTLQGHAARVIEALNDSRYPKSGRKTSRLKQLWFLSRALAGAAQGISTRTAINLLGSVRPDEIGDISKLTKRTRRPKKSTRKRS